LGHGVGTIWNELLCFDALATSLAKPGGASKQPQPPAKTRRRQDQIGAHGPL